MGATPFFRIGTIRKAWEKQRETGMRKGCECENKSFSLTRGGGRNLPVSRIRG